MLGVQAAIGYTENCRLVFGEADGLPQLIIDKFNDYFVIQTLALGIDNWKPAIVKALQTVFNPKGFMNAMMCRYGNWKAATAKRIFIRAI